MFSRKPDLKKGVSLSELAFMIVYNYIELRPSGPLPLRPDLEEVPDGPEGQPQEGQGGRQGRGGICAILFLRQ